MMGAAAPPKVGKFVFLNGAILPASRACVSAFDRGFLFGDGLFETMRAYSGRLFCLEDHLKRLRSAASRMGIKLPRYDWHEAIEELLKRNRHQNIDAVVRLTVTRGTGEPHLLPPAHLTPTVFMFSRPVDAWIERAQRSGVGVVLLNFQRDPFLAGLKTIAYVTAIFGKRMAARNGAMEGIYTQRGRILEGTTSSVFVVRQRTLITPRIAAILPGITRNLVARIAREAGFPVRERYVSIEDFRTADEAFLTGSVAEIIPIVRVDGRPIGNGRPGPVTRTLQTLYRNARSRRPEAR